MISPTDAEGMFDILTYEKGAAVVRMLEQYLGFEAFRDGIRSYLTTHSYGNTETTDLWDALEESTGEPVRRIMDSWIFQGGFPVIDVDLFNEGSTLRFRQERFGYAGDVGEGDPEADRDLAPAVDAAVYRLAQESITNAIKHARRATRIRVAVEGEPDGVRLTVSDDGEAAPVNGSSSGYGIIGMEERVSLLGGTFEAGPNMTGVNFAAGKAFVISSTSGLVYVYDLKALKPAGRMKIGTNIQLETANRLRALATWKPSVSYNVTDQKASTGGKSALSK